MSKDQCSRCGHCLHKEVYDQEWGMIIGTYICSIGLSTWTHSECADHEEGVPIIQRMSEERKSELRKWA